MGERLSDQFGYLIATVNKRLEEQLAHQFRAESIPIEQWRVLGALADRNGRTMSGLAADVLVEAPSLTKIIDRMVSEGLVYRAPDTADRRRVLVFLSARGAALHGRLQELAAEQQRAIVDRLGPDGAGNLRALLEAMLADRPGG